MDKYRRLRKTCVLPVQIQLDPTTLMAVPLCVQLGWYMMYAVVITAYRYKTTLPQLHQPQPWMQACAVWRLCCSCIASHQGPRTLCAAQPSSMGDAD
jgi:hypothetical protein